MPIRSIDGAVAHFVGGIVAEFNALVGDDTAVAAVLRSMGLDEATAQPTIAYVQQRAGDLDTIATAVTRIVEQLGSSSPDIARLIVDVKDSWEALTRLTEAAPVLPPAPTLPPVNILERLLATVVERQARATAPLVWTTLSALGIFGTGQSPIEAVAAAISDPFGYAFSRYLAVRDELTINLSGLLTGPRTSSLATSSLGEGLPVPAAVAALAPQANRVVQRVRIGLATDTFGAPLHITLDVMATATETFGGMALRIEPLIEPTLALGEHVELALAPLNQEMGVVITGFGALRALSADPSLIVRSTFTESLMLGTSGGLHVELAEPQLGATITPSGWGLTFGFGRFEVVVPNRIAGDVVGLFLPDEGIRLKGTLLFHIDADGFHLDGAVGLSVRAPDVIRLPGITVQDLVTTIQVGGAGVGVRAAGTVAIRLGPLAITIEGLGAALAISPPEAGRANLGLANIDPPEFVMPTGFGLSIDAGVISGGGFVRHDPVRGEWAGALELTLRLGPIDLSVKAFGIFGTIGGSISFVVVLTMEFNPPVELFLGLTLNGVGGVFGMNRSMDKHELFMLVSQGRADDLLFPHDLIARAPAIIDAAQRVFPAKRDQVVVGPLFKLGWGRPTSFVTLTVGVVTTFPNPVLVALVGRVTIALPDPALAIIDIRADFDGIIDLTNGDVEFFASLNNSRIGLFHIGGDIALRAGSRGFVFSAGGFHPRFQAPDDFPELRRLSVDLSPGPIVQISAQAYLAVTASTFQFGARAFLKAELGPFGAKGDIGLDVIIHTEPRFMFSAEISGDFALTVFGEELFSARLELLLEGPGRWYAHAHVSIKILFVRISGTLDLHWGDDADAKASPPVDPALAVHNALAADATWSPLLPAEHAGVVQLRRGAAGLHPLGSLRLSQTVAPVGIGLQRIGSSRVSSADPVTVTFTASGGVAHSTTDLFATAQYFDRTDEERLSQPAFAPFTSGAVVQGEDWRPGAVRADAVVYEESLDDDDAPFDRVFITNLPDLVGWLSFGAVGRAQPVKPGQDVEMLSMVSRGSVATAGLTVTEGAFAVADAATRSPIRAAGGFASAMAAVLARSVDQVIVADYEMAG